MWDEKTKFEAKVAVGICGGLALMSSDDGGMLFDVCTDNNSAEFIEEMLGDVSLKSGMYSVTGIYCHDCADENGQSSSEFKNVKWELIK